MSAQERLAALLEHLGYGDTTDRLTGGPDVYQEWGMTPREFAARLIAAGVSVPTEPGAPDPLRACEYRFTSGMPCAALPEHDVHHGRWTRGPEPNHDFVPRHERRSGRDRRTSRPVPAPEPSARLREALPEADTTSTEGGTFQWGYRAGWNAARAIALAATPQDPEA